MNSPKTPSAAALQRAFDTLRAEVHASASKPVRRLPEHLHAAYDHTDAGGELDELRSLRGRKLAAYARASTANAAAHDDPSVTETDLLELHDWLQGEA